MSLLNYAMNIAGFCGSSLLPSRIKPGHTVTKIEWRGCMATERIETDIGDIIRHAPSPHSNGKYPGVIVKWEKEGERWEPLDNFREVKDELEVWS